MAANLIPHHAANRFISPSPDAGLYQLLFAPRALRDSKYFSTVIYTALDPELMFSAWPALPALSSMALSVRCPRSAPDSRRALLSMGC